MNETKKIKQWIDYKGDTWEELKRKNKTWLEVKAEIEKLDLTITARQKIDKVSNSFIESLEIQTQVFSNDVIKSFYSKLLESFPLKVQNSSLLQAILKTFDIDLSEVEKIRLDVLNSLNISTVNSDKISLYESEYGIKTEYELGFTYRRNRIKAEIQKKWKQLNLSNIRYYAGLFNQGKVFNVFIDNQTLYIQMQVNNDPIEHFKNFILNICEAHLDLEIKKGAVWGDYKGKSWSELKGHTWDIIARGDLVNGTI